MHELNLQLDEIERVYYLLVSGAITGDKASELLETYQARLNACAKKADEFARVNVYRLYNPNSGEHHYTLSETERTYLAQAGWKDEGVGWKAPARQQQLPVYRLYNPKAGDHHYTTGIEERTFLIEAGWQDEGISWYSDTASQGLAIYRLYNPNAKTGSHHYTDSERENQALAAMGWQAEGISWYGLFPYSILWQSEGDKEGWVAYDNDTDQQVTGRITIAGTGYYYKPQDGYRLCGFGTAEDPDNPARSITIYADDEGRIQTGWVAFDQGQRYFKPSSWEMITGFYQTDRGFCHFQKDGLLTTQSFSNGPARITIDSQGLIVKTELNVGYLAQNDPQWKNRWIGGWQFGGTGCVPTVLTMIINTLTNAAYIPTQVGEQIHQAGYFNTDDFGTTAEAIPYTASLYGLKLAASLSLSLAAQVLQQGGMLCAAMDPGLFCSPGFTHEIVVFGYENGRVRVFDPYWPEHNGIYDLSIIFTQKSTNKDDNRAGGPIFGWMIQGR